MYVVNATHDVLGGVRSRTVGVSYNLVPTLRMAKNSRYRGYTFMHPDACVEVVRCPEGQAYDSQVYGEDDRPPPPNSPVVCTLKMVDDQWDVRWHDETLKRDYEYELAQSQRFGSALVA
jgi:hypothetical protein